MDGLHFEAISQASEALISDSRVLDRHKDWTPTVPPRSEAAKPIIQEDKDCAMGDAEEFAGECMICDSGSRLIPRGFSRSSCTGEIVMFVNAGGEAPRGDLSIKFLADDFYEGGDVLRTDECINEGGNYPSIYQSARLGNFSYQLNGLTSGDYFVDLHFVEIINTNGPKGMRVFNVFIQDEKVLSDLDIFAVVGANKPLQLVDSRVSVKEDGKVVIRFEGVLGSPVVSGICIRRAPKLSDSQLIHEYVRCRNCAAEIEVPLTQEKGMRLKSTAKYEKKIEELSIQCQRKTDECHQAWMSLTAANKQLEKVRMELDNNSLQTYSLDQKVEKQAEELRAISHRYEHDKKGWMMAITNLKGQIKKMKEEHSQLSRDAHECVDSIPELNKMVFAVQSLVAQCEDLKVKYIEEQTKRKKLYNQVQEARGFFCRCRPLNKHEQAAGSATIVDFDGAKDGEVGILTGGSTKKTFKFDKVYTPKDDQGDVFADASPMVISVLDGYNVCIFAYGQTGTGKTFTMEGTVQNRGVNYRTLEQLFEIAKERSDTFKYNISVSVLEVYNEQIRDLLTTSPAPKKLEIKQASEGSNHVPGIVEANVESITEVWDVLQTGSNARAVGSNNLNEHSSRSHCMLCIMVRAKNLMNGECTKSKLWLVDLAGSERLAKTDVQGERLKEAQNINRSLSALGDVISALANKSSHIPYRNSKLTHLLQDSLGGDSKTLMFVQISPSEQDLGETLSSLNFASRVRGIDLGPAKRQIDTSELQKTKILLDKTRQESKCKDESIRKLEESLQNLENKARSKDQTYKNQQEKIRELEDQIELKATSQSQLEKQLFQLQERLRGKEEACTSLQHKVKELENKLKEREHSDSTALQQVRHLEEKLRDQELESELCHISLQKKVNELERKLKDQVDNTNSSILHEKIKELEDKLREFQEQHMEPSILPIDYALRAATPTMLKPILTGEMMGEVEPFVLRSSNSSNQTKGHSPFSLKGGEIRNETRRKREFRNSDIENNMPIPAPLVQDKKIRKSDPPPRVIMKTAKQAAVAQRLQNHSRMNRDQVQARETKKRIWC
ncbi:Kinesin-like protein KIN-14R [Ancistrocladus abbreviatus]